MNLYLEALLLAPQGECLTRNVNRPSEHLSRPVYKRKRVSRVHKRERLKGKELKYIPGRRKVSGRLEPCVGVRP